MSEQIDAETAWLLVAGAAQAGWTAAKRDRILGRLRRGEPVRIDFATDADGTVMQRTWVGTELAFAQPANELGIDTTDIPSG